MELKKNFIDDITNCEWLTKCGKKDIFSFDIILLDEENALNSICNPKWERVWMDARDDFTDYLDDTCKELYERVWNKYVKKYREEFANPLSESLKKRYPDNEIYETFIGFVRSNIIFMFMYNLFSDYYKCRFFDEMLEIYLNGHVPCGWEGKYPNGKFKVF